MAKLFTSKTSSVTHIPSEKDVDPELLENNPRESGSGGGLTGKGTGSDHDFRDSNSSDRFGTRTSALQWVRTAKVQGDLTFSFNRTPTPQEFKSWAKSAGISQKISDFNIYGASVQVKTGARADKSFVGQHRDDGSYVIEEVPESEAEVTAKNITEAPDANRAHVLRAPDAEAARGKMYDKMKSRGIEPASRDLVFSPTASYVVKSGSRYFKFAGSKAVIVGSEEEATKFATEDEAPGAAQGTSSGRVVSTEGPAVMASEENDDLQNRLGVQASEDEAPTPKQAAMITAAEKLAWSASVKKEVITRFGKTQGFQAMDEAGLDQFLSDTEKLVPVENAKKYLIYLAAQYFGPSPKASKDGTQPPRWTPAWVPGEDDAIIRPLMHNFEKLVKANKLQGPEADLNSYKQLDQLKAAVTKAMESEGPEAEAEVSDEEEAAKPRFDVHRKKYLPQDLQDIQANTKIIAEADGYAVYAIPQRPSEGQMVAMTLLCNNGINKVSWCVGRDTRNYFADGPFYVLVKGGKSRYAISTKVSDNSATIWNPADTPIWVTTSGGAGGFGNLMGAAQAKQIPLDLTQVSSLPADVIPVLAAARQHDPILAKMIPETHLVQGDTVALDKAIMATPVQGLVGDLVEGFSSERTMGLAAAVMGRCIAMHYDFSPEYSMFNENLLVGYIELLAAAGQGLPKTLEDAIIQAIQATS